MRQWGSSDQDASANALPWVGHLSGVMRPAAPGQLVRLFVVAGILYGVNSAAFVTAVVVAPGTVAHVSLTWCVVAFGSTSAVVFLSLALLMSPQQLRRHTPVIYVTGVFASGPAVSVGVIALGPGYGIWAGAYVEALWFGFYMLRRPWAVCATALTLVEFGIVVATEDGWPAPAVQVVFAAATALAMAFLVGAIAERADELSRAEHDARVQLAGVNHTLEERVTEQVHEIEKLGELRRFLSPQVADAVLAAGAADAVRPHRRRIAVCCCDLRGFTGFTNAAEPEEVVEVLDEYYREVGDLLQAYGATIGDYAGDGIMAYFGDPVPCTKPALTALRMSADLRERMGRTTAEWERRGYDLGFGVGLTYGYATLGVVGFDGRYDYKPMGAVVNLASRLCAQATRSDVLVDHPTYAEADGALALEPVPDLELKGFGAGTRAYRLV